MKYQTFRPEDLATERADRAEYQKDAMGGGSGQRDMLNGLVLDEAAHRDAIACCAEIGIDFISSAFDPASMQFLAGTGMKTWKIPSGEITNYPFLKAVGAQRKRVFLATGMADLGEIEDALEVLTGAGTRLEEITVLHCTSAYPTPCEAVNLRAMLTVRDAFGVSIGYSDHTEGIEVALAAVALGATVIEKHFTLDRKQAGPDHRSSIEPPELRRLVASIRHIELCLGDGRKAPQACELPTRVLVRKSIVAARRIEAGEVFTEENLATKRPGTGLSPMVWPDVLGRRAGQPFAKDEEIRL